MHSLSKLTPNRGMQATVTSGLRPPVPGPDANRYAAFDAAPYSLHDGCGSAENV